MDQIPIKVTLIVKAPDEETAKSIVTKEMNNWFTRDINSQQYPTGSLLWWGMSEPKVNNEA